MKKIKKSIKLYLIAYLFCFTLVACDGMRSPQNSTISKIFKKIDINLLETIRGGLPLAPSNNARFFHLN